MASCDFNQLIAALATPPQERSSALLTDIRSNLSLTLGLRRLQEEINDPHLVEFCAQTMQLCSYAPNEVIIHRGNPQPDFLLLLKGNAAMTFPSNLLSVVASLYGRRNSERRTTQAYLNRLDTELLTTALLEFETKTLHPGDALGENAFAAETTNLYSINSLTHSVIASMSVHEFRVRSQELREKAHRVKADLIKTLPGFSQFTYSYINRLAPSFKERTYAYGQVVYKEGAKCEAMYAVKSGQVELSQTPLSKDTSAKKLWIKTAGEMVGEQDLLVGSTHLHTCTSRANGTVLYGLSQKVFKELIHRTKLASQLTSRSKEHQDGYASREVSASTKLNTRKKIVLKPSKSYSRHQSQPPAKLLADLNRTYDRYRLHERSETPSFKERTMTPVSLGSRSPLSPISRLAPPSLARSMLMAMPRPWFTKRPVAMMASAAVSPKTRGRTSLHRETLGHSVKSQG
jgi:CRP-like cAMP-binding protein